MAEPSVDDKLLRGYARLAALRTKAEKNPASAELGEEYNSVATDIAGSIERDLSEFTLGEDAFWTDSGRRGRDGKPVRYVNASMFLARLDGLLYYLKLLVPSDSGRKIGF